MNTLLLEDTPVGDDLDIQRDVSGVTASDPIVKAWLTVKAKRTDADPGALQKIITATPVAGVGQIAQDGSAGNGDGTGSVVFQLTKADTTALGTLIRYYWDIQFLTASSKIYTSADPDSGRTVGRLQLRSRVTLAST